jgi:hypothetical protein
MAPGGLALRERTVQADSNHSHLLSLPKELRLEIWRYTVTDPSVDELVLHIDRDLCTSSKRFCNSLRQHIRFHASVTATLEKPRNCPIDVNILRTNRFVYFEALPLLYHSVKFCPWGTSSIFPTFLSTLSNFAKQQIRYIKLYVDQHIETKYHFNWAVTCAQVASLPCLREVEIESSHMFWLPPGRIKQRMLRPLLKIKVPKKLVPGKDEAFQKMLEETAGELEDEKKARAERLQLKAAERVEQRKFNTAVDVGGGGEKGQTCLLPTADEQAIASGRYMVEEIDQAERDLDGWDIINARICSPEPAPGTKRARSDSDDSSWADESPLLDDQDSHSIGNDWEMIEHQHSDDDSTLI